MKYRRLLKKSLKRFYWHLKKDWRVMFVLTMASVGLMSAIALVLTSQELRRGAQGANATITFTPGTSSLATNQSHTILVKANTTSYLTDGIQVIADITGTIPENISFTPETIPGLSVVVSRLTTVSSSTKKLEVILRTTDPLVPYSTNNSLVTIGRITFTSPSFGTMAISFTTTPTISKITQNKTTANVLSTILPITYRFSDPTDPTETSPTPTATTDTNPTPTATDVILSPTPTATATSTQDTLGFLKTLTLNAAFAGVSGDKGPIEVQIKLGKAGSSNPEVLTNSVFTYTDSGYTATINLEAFSLPVQEVYWLTLKGEKHLQKAFNNLSLTPTHSLNLTYAPLLPGDLPVQDGVVDANDLNKLLSIIAKTFPTLSDLDTGDVNYDGRVNSVDFGLVLTTLSSQIN